MVMQESIKEILFDAWDYCDDKDKSTEFMLQYMQNMARVNLDTVLRFIQENSSTRFERHKKKKK